VEGYLPHSRTTDPKVTEAVATDVEEERRLFYVGVTRARERLYLSWPVRRNVRGRVAPFVPSRFLDGLPEEWTKAMEPIDTKPLDYEETVDAASAIMAMLKGKG
jgi:superfamily I DNA/RNA helicase